MLTFAQYFKLHLSTYTPMNTYHYKLMVALSVIIITLTGCKHEPFVEVQEIDEHLLEYIRSVAPDGDEGFYMLPSSESLFLLPQDPKNPLNQAKVQLGKMLFFEPGMGVDSKHDAGIQTYSCATCHTPEAGFRIGRAQGIADGAYGMGHLGDMRLIHQDYTISELDVQGARPLSVLNVGVVKNTMWSGAFGSDHNNVGTEAYWVGDFAFNYEGFHALESQNFSGLIVHRQDMYPSMAADFGYTDLFNAAFPELPESERITQRTASLAISAYLRTLYTTEAPFQRWLRGFRDEMTEDEKKGAILFFGKANCWRCHNEKNLGGDTFHRLGVKDLYEHPESVGFGPSEGRNFGRAFLTKQPEDFYKFRVPQLYNMKNAPVFFHGSSKNSLEEVVDYKLAATSENANVTNDMLSPLFEPVTLTAQEKAQLIQFLKNALHDPNINRFVPESVGSGMCFPNNDPISKAQMGCE
jgi:cytochrome c peroxidase